MIDLRDHDEGVVLRVRAQPGARCDEIRGLHNGAVRVAVSQAPEKGKANQAIARVVAGELRLRKSQVLLLSGETSREKQFLIRDLSSADLKSRLSAVLDAREAQRIFTPLLAVPTKSADNRRWRAGDRHFIMRERIC